MTIIVIVTVGGATAAESAVGDTASNIHDRRDFDIAAVFCFFL